MQLVQRVEIEFSKTKNFETSETRSLALMTMTTEGRGAYELSSSLTPTPSEIS